MQTVCRIKPPNCCVSKPVGISPKASNIKIFLHVLAVYFLALLNLKLTFLNAISFQPWATIGFRFKHFLTKSDKG